MMFNEILTESSLFFNEEALQEKYTLTSKKMSESDIKKALAGPKVKEKLAKFKAKGFVPVNGSLKGKIEEKRFKNYYDIIRGSLKDARMKLELKMINGMYCALQYSYVTKGITGIFIFVYNEKTNKLKIVKVQESLLVI